MTLWQHARSKRMRVTERQPVESLEELKIEKTEENPCQNWVTSLRFLIVNSDALPVRPTWQFASRS